MARRMCEKPAAPIVTNSSGNTSEYFPAPGLKASSHW
jgi:hypothetical protein